MAGNAPAGIVLPWFFVSRKLWLFLKTYAAYGSRSAIVRHVVSVSCRLTEPYAAADNHNCNHK